jgi:hypothetical protein
MLSCFKKKKEQPYRANVPNLGGQRDGIGSGCFDLHIRPFFLKNKRKQEVARRHRKAWQLTCSIVASYYIRSKI